MEQQLSMYDAGITENIETYKKGDHVSYRGKHYVVIEVMNAPMANWKYSIALASGEILPDCAHIKTIFNAHVGELIPYKFYLTMKGLIEV